MSDGRLTGEVLDGRYALGALYGTGGMAEVYQAFDTELDRKVAIKVFRGTATSEDGIRLGREADVLARLWRPGMVVVHGTGSFRGSPFFVMQAVEGGTLRRWIREPPASEAVATIGAQVAEVLAHVHRHDVVHRDVKPSNILLDRDGRRAYLTDFGLALQANITRVTRTGVVVGTPGYLSPEQVRGDDVTPAADVFALGLVLLECLTGRPEYPGGDSESALARLHRGPLIPDDLPAPWRELLTAMTGLSPRRRPTAAECAEQLAAASGSSSSSASSPDVEPIAVADAVVARRGVRTRLLLAGAAAVVFTGTALLAALDPTDAPSAGDDRPRIDTSAEPGTPTSSAAPSQLPATSSVPAAREVAAGTTVTRPGAVVQAGQPHTAQQQPQVAGRPTPTSATRPEPPTRPTAQRPEVGVAPGTGAVTAEPRDEDRGGEVGEGADD